MRKKTSLTGVLLVLLPLCLAAAQSDYPLANVVDQVRDSVVSVSTKSIAFGSVTPGMFGESSRYQQILTGWLTGFVYDKKGYVITDSQSVEGAAMISVFTADNTELQAEVVGLDSDYGVGVIKVHSDKPLKPAKLLEAKYDPLKEYYPYDQGDQVLAIGASGGMGGTVTSGIISAVRNLRNRSGVLIPSMIQSDVMINSGNEGCPLLTMDGEVIGMHEMRGTSPRGLMQNTTFFTPIWLVKRVASELIANYESKKPVKDFKVWHPWLGIKAYVNVEAGTDQGVGDDLKMFLDVPDQYWDTGIFIDQIYTDSPASEFGLMPKDYVFSVTVLDKNENEKIPYTLLKNVETLELMVTTAEKGDIFVFQVLRLPSLLNVEVVVGQHPGAFDFFSRGALEYEWSYEYF
jgi:S1-C subfamily serine protease